MAGARGYRGFGSFFSDNVEVLIAQPDDVYVPPADPFTPADTGVAGAAQTRELGELIRRDFLVDFSTWTFLNHGAFGAVNKPAFEAAQRWRALCEAQPLAFLDRTLLPHVVHATRLLAACLRASPRDVVLCQSCTHALNAVIFSAALAPNDTVVCLSLGYGAVKKMCILAAARAGASFAEIEIRFPLRGGADDVVRLVDASLPASTALVVLDFVTSNTALALPLAELVPLIRSRCPHAVVVIDAAHALGATALLDVPSLGADFVAGNCHKHWCAPRGSAFLWAAPGAARAWLRPVVVSHGTGRGFFSDFAWDGNRDYSPVLSLGATLTWWASIGQERGVEYMRQALRDGALTLLSRWRTSLLVPLALCTNMCVVRLPEAGVTRPAPAGEEELLSRHPPEGNGHFNSDDAKAFQDELFAAAIEVPVKCIQGRLYVRCSAHVYTINRDFERLATFVDTTSTLRCS